RELKLVRKTIENSKALDRCTRQLASDGRDRCADVGRSVGENIVQHSLAARVRKGPGIENEWIGMKNERQHGACGRRLRALVVDERPHGHELKFRPMLAPHQRKPGGK